MEALALTYETLATTRNEAAIDVLLSLLGRPNDPNRKSAINALLRRTEPRAPESLLASWETLAPEDIYLMRASKKWFKESIATALEGKGDSLARAIQAASDLRLVDVVPKLILLAESHGVAEVRQAAGDAVQTLVAPLGDEARNDRGQAAVRGPIIARLVDSVRRFAMHRNEQMVESFLMTSAWSDPDLRQILSEPSTIRELIAKQLAQSTQPGVLDLLAGYIRRKNMPDWLASITTGRQDVAFRDALLRRIGSEPTATSLKNLQAIGMPQSCAGDEATFASLPNELRGAFAHVYSETAGDPVKALHVICAAIEGGPRSATSAGAIALSRCKLPDEEIWMRAAIPVADDNQEAIKSRTNARLLHRLIEMLGHGDQTVVRGVQRVLAPLHAEKMLTQFQDLRPRSRRRLGRVVMMVDPTAIERVRDSLRHPVLARRLEAIATADALAAVDLLSDSFAHIVREDHQEARSRAAEALASAESEETMQLLQEMISLPECQARDSALMALQQRQQASPARRS